MSGTIDTADGFSGKHYTHLVQFRTYNQDWKKCYIKVMNIAETVDD